ncbi:metalloregulator ArsR/SmtB family transcription factor [Sphingomonas sp. DG1-23]|uniref:ArsR/SmtB family transcription factor n=1 Tax=Sphingomonas sp. DG1-23 TaxID=3068316 RepID=UPI00273FD223|nr:metalloregulator ArsR/SmtB family transcription factor [Sphingomonas sp. DG1-23]MDP5279371.1 metalloregulator ArsR/SmtB family transcription factor [Sphingomonas sp. DG1-23]
MDPARFAAFANLMVGYRLDTVFHALADPTRRAMLARLAGGEKPVAELIRGFPMSDAGAAKHLAVLESAGLVGGRREGRRRLCALDTDPLGEAALWLRRWQLPESPRIARLRGMLDAAERLA